MSDLNLDPVLYLPLYPMIGTLVGILAAAAGELGRGMSPQAAKGFGILSGVLWPIAVILLCGYAVILGWRHTREGLRALWAEWRTPPRPTTPELSEAEREIEELLRTVGR